MSRKTLKGWEYFTNLPHTADSYAAYMAADAKARKQESVERRPSEIPSPEAATYVSACIGGAGKTDDVEPSIDTQIKQETRDRMIERARQGRL